MEIEKPLPDECVPMTFHDYHGKNIILFENNTVAYRRSGYAHGITFSSKPLSPGEIFLFEIERFEHGWIGNLRCGLTQENPSTKFELPQYTVPIMNDTGKSWIVPISNTELEVYEKNCINRLYPDIFESNNDVHTSKGTMPKSLLLPVKHNKTFYGKSDDEASTSSFSSEENSDENSENSYTEFARFGLSSADYLKEEGFRNGKYIYPADVGSRIGVTYVIKNNIAYMYIIINGDVYGPCATIPFRKNTIYAVVDLYGTTKKVRVVQACGIPSLKIVCRDKILQQVPRSGVIQLPLPNKLIQFLDEKYY